MVNKMKRLEVIFPDGNDVKIAKAALQMLSEGRLKRRTEVVPDLTSRARELDIAKSVSQSHYAKILAELRREDYIIYDESRDDPLMRATANGKDFIKSEYGAR